MAESIHNHCRPAVGRLVLAAFALGLLSAATVADVTAAGTSWIGSIDEAASFTCNLP